MSDSLATFESLLHNRLIPEFCGDSSRGCTIAGFRQESAKVGAFDAAWFVRGFEAGLIEHCGRGLYRGPNSSAKEQFFWEGPRAEVPRRFSLWKEPVITIGALARLHFEFGWPKALLGTQSVDFAFDVVALHPRAAGEAVAGEVKKSVKELEELIRWMQALRLPPEMLEPPSQPKAINAYKKVAALRARRAPVFWAVGPDGLSHVFKPTYGEQGEVNLVPARMVELRFSLT